VAAARATLEAGFTTLRDLGTEGAAFADVALREAIKKGTIAGPRLFVATRAIVATGSYEPKAAQEARGADEVRKAAREQIAAGADWIKVYADYGKPAKATFTVQELKAAVHEAQSAGLPVASHAVTDEGIRRSVKAGVDTIEHGFDASLDTFKLMRDHNVVLCPTLAAGEAIPRYAGKPSDRARRMFERALASGVTLACGSDVGVFAHGENAREIELMIEYGLAPLQALRAATCVAADVLRQPDLGRIKAGAKADLVGVSGNPLKDPSVLRRPVLVIKEGRRVI
jgi:imidazolonepropionase-like amidohydrolase